jgi:hypothetical protein
LLLSPSALRFLLFIASGCIFRRSLNKQAEQKMQRIALFFCVAKKQKQDEANAAKQALRYTSGLLASHAALRRL